MSVATLETPVNGLDVDVFTQAETISATQADSQEDPKVAKLRAEEDASTGKVVAKFRSTLDDPSALAKHVACGKAFHEHVVMVKLKMRAAWDKADYDSVAAEVEKRIKMVVAISDPRVDDDHRAHLFVEAFKEKAPSVTKLSYHQVINHFVPACVRFNKKDIEATVKKGWFDFTVELINAQAGGEAMKMAELKAAIAAHTIKLADDEKSGKSPEDIARADDAKRAREANSKRQSARKAVGDSIAKAGEARLTTEDIARTIAECGITLPEVGFVPAKMKAADAKEFVAALVDAENGLTIMALHRELSKVIAEMQQLAHANNEQAAAA